MTRDDWRELAYWCSAAGAFLMALAVAHALLGMVYFLTTGNLWPVAE